MRFLQLTGSDVTLGSDLMRNHFLVHLDVRACGLRHLPVITLPNLRELDVSNNELNNIECWHFAEVRLNMSVD
jgi:Leucine-rich repeat (LRR) protein